MGVLVADAVGREHDVAHLVDGGVALVDEPAQDLGGLHVVAGLVLLLGQLILQVLGLPLDFLRNLLAVRLLDLVLEGSDLLLSPTPLAADLKKVRADAFLHYSED